jgi:hypothetical protein
VCSSVEPAVAFAYALSKMPNASLGTFLRQHSAFPKIKRRQKARGQVLLVLLSVAQVTAFSVPAAGSSA